MKTHKTSERELSDLTVLVTRPIHQQESLIQTIENLNGKTVSMPLIDICSLDESEIASATSNAIKNLDQFDILIFISSNAARIGGEMIDRYWPQFPVGITVIGIGQSTSREVTDLLNCVVETPARGSDSEAVLALPQLQNVAEKRIGIVRGVGGRELLASELSQRGAQVQTIEVYRREPREYEPERVNQLLFDSACNTITVHSGASLQQLVALSGNNISQITLIPLIVPSARVQNQAQEAGFSRVINAVGADDQAMTQALQQVAADRV